MKLKKNGFAAGVRVTTNANTPTNEMNTPSERPRNMVRFSGFGTSQRKARAQLMGTNISGMPKETNIATPATIK
jgi:hypothetical protein